MKKWIGLGIILFDIILLVAIYCFVNRRGVYKGDFIGLLLDSWEIIGLFIAILLVGLMLLIE